MRLGSKRWHRASRSKWRRGCGNARRILSTTAIPVTEEAQRHYNRAVRWLNSRLHRMRDAQALWDGIVECPKCTKSLPMMADADEWERHDGRRRLWRVTGYSCPLVHCCDLMIVENFGRIQVYDVAGVKVPANPTGGRHRDEYRYKVSLRWHGRALRDARGNWDVFEEHLEDLTEILNVYRRDRDVVDLAGKRHNPQGTLTAWLWACGKANGWLIDFCEHYQSLHLRRGLIIYCTQLLRELENAGSAVEPHPELFNLVEA